MASFTKSDVMGFGMGASNGTWCLAGITIPSPLTFGTVGPQEASEAVAVSGHALPVPVTVRGAAVHRVCATKTNKDIHKSDTKKKK